MERLHHGDRYPLRLTSAEERRALRGAADAVCVAAFEVIRRIDRKHHHVDPPAVEELFRHRRGMGRESDVAHNALPVQFLHIRKDPVVPQCVDVVHGVHTVEEAEIHVIRTECRQLPLERPLDRFEVPGPAVFALFVVDRAEMELEIHLVPSSGNGASERCIHAAAARAQIEKVDPVVDRCPDDRLNLVRRGSLDAAHTQSERTDAFAAVQQSAIFHHFSNSFATSFSSARIGRCWGQAFSHFPQPMQSDALPWFFVWTFV